MTRVKFTICPWCRKRHDLVSAVTEPGRYKREPQPENGDATYCLGCGQASIFDSSNPEGLRFPNEDEMVELAKQAMPAQIEQAFALLPDRVRRPILFRPKWMGKRST